MLGLAVASQVDLGFRVCFSSLCAEMSGQAHCSDEASHSPL